MVPMVLTVLRMVLAPVFFGFYALASAGSPSFVIGVWLVFAAIEISDVLDGHLARSLRQETEAGKVLDPLADSVSRLTYFLCLTGTGIMPLWVLLILIYRDLGVAYIRVMVSRSSVLLPARLSGKLKAWVYAFTGGVGIAVFSVRRLGWLPSLQNVAGTISLGLCVLAALIAVWSLADYAAFFLRNFRRTS
ncbi:MAG TPA: CDP-alcohol phosphatidyltransferase family protein [Spirochaetia bacterium]|nr:CDP-alcohol phosphatidyltransferase family protein [Spirochaetia bacterium]